MFRRIKLAAFLLLFSFTGLYAQLSVGKKVATDGFTWHEERYAGQSGALDANQERLIPTSYDLIIYHPTCDGWFEVRNQVDGKSKCGIYTPKGKKICDAIYDKVHCSKNEISANSTEKAVWYTVETDGKKGVLDENGNFLIQLTDLYEGTLICVGGVFKYKSSDGKWIGTGHGLREPKTATDNTPVSAVRTLDGQTSDKTVSSPSKKTSGKVASSKVKTQSSSGTTGTAPARINGQTVNVRWVQLWKNGPKFAVFNVGAGTETDCGTALAFTDAVKEGKDYVWGTNWRTPGKDELDMLNQGKVTVTYCQEGSVWGYKLTGNESGYTSNSIFLPAYNGNENRGQADLWSSSSDGEYVSWRFSLSVNYDGEFSGNWYTIRPSEENFIRPVLIK